jgi:hypothetical protein
MVEVDVVLNRIARKVLKERATIVACTEAEYVVQIASLGLIVVRVVLNTMDIAQLVSNDAFPMMHAVKLSMRIPKKLW